MCYLEILSSCFCFKIRFESLSLPFFYMAIKHDTTRRKATYTINLLEIIVTSIISFSVVFYKLIYMPNELSCHIYNIMIPHFHFINIIHKISSLIYIYIYIYIYIIHKIPFSTKNFVIK